MKKKSYKLVMVEWDDAHCAAGWKDDEELDSFALSTAFQCVNVGFLVREGKDYIVLAARISPHDNQYGLIERLPKKMLKSVRNLKPKQ